MRWRRSRSATGRDCGRCGSAARRARSPRALYSATGRRFTPPPCETPQRVLELEATLMAFVRNKGKSTSRVGVQHQTSTNIKLQVSETENSTGVGLVAAASQAHLWSGAPVDPCTTAWFFGSVHSQRRCDRQPIARARPHCRRSAIRRRRGTKSVAAGAGV